MTKNNLPVIDNTNQGNKITAPVRNKKKGLPSLPNSNNDSQPLFTSPYNEKDDEGNWTTAGIFAEANRRNMSGDTDNARAILSEYRAGLTTQGSRYYNPYYAGANIDEKKGTTATKNTELFRQDMNTMFNDVQWYVAAGYSDAWIKSHVSVMNYSQLAKMEENASYGTPLAMTGTVDYMGEDTVNGMIYAARNGEDLSGGLFTAVGLHYMGMGNQWEADSSKIAALDVTNDEGYDPYSYFGVSGDKASTYARKYGTTAFTSEWLSNPENKRKAAENGDYEYISNLIANTDATVEERNRLYETAYKRLEAGATPEEVYEYYFGKGEGSDPMRVLQKGDEYSAYESDANGYKHLYDMEYRRQMKGASDLAYDVPFTATAFKRYLNDANSEITMNKRYAAVKEQTNIYTNSVPERYWDSVLGLFMWTKGMDDLSTEEATEMVQSPEFMAELNTFVTDNGLTVENASEFDADANGQAYAEKIYGIEQRVMGEREEEQARADAEKAASIEIDPGWTASKFISEADVSTPEGSAEMAEFNLAMDNYFSGKPVTDENAAAMIEKYPWLFDQVEGRGTAKKMTTQQKSMLSYASAGAGTMSGMPGVGSYIDTDTYTEEGKTVTVYSQGQNAADFFGEDDWQHDGDSIAYKMHHAYTEWQDGNLSSEMYYSMLARIASACEQYGVEGVKSDTDGVISALFSDVEANIAENKNNKVESIKRNGTSTIQRYNDISARLKANGADSLSEDEKGFYWNVTNAVFSSDISQTPFHFSGNDSALESGRFYTMYEGERVSLYDYMDRAITDRFSRQARNSEFANIQFSIGDAEYFDQITGTTASYISGYAQDQLITMQRWSAYTGMSIEDTLQAFGYSDFDDFCARSYGEGLKELESANLSVTNEVKNEMHLIEGSMDYYLRIGEGVSEAYGKAYDPEKWTESFKETDARETGSAAGALGVTPETAEEVYGTSNNFFQIAGRGIATGSVDFWGSWVDSAYQFIRMDPEERDEYFRGTFSREEMRSVIEERINGIENKELREYYQEYYRNYTGDIYDFDIEFYGDELYLRDWSANIQETSRAMREEAQAILSPEAYRRYEITAGATLSIESSIVTALETYALVKMGMPSAAAGLIAQLNTTGFVTAGESLGELKDQGVYDKSGYAIAVGALTALSEWGMGEMVFKYLAGPKTMKYLDSATTLDSKAIAARFGRFLANRGTSPALVKLGTGAMRYGSAGLNIILQTAKSSVGNSVQEVAQDQYQKMGIALATGKSVSEGWLSCDEARSTFWTSIEQGLVQSVMQSPYSAIHAYSDAKAQRKSDKSARAEINGMIGQQAEAVTAVKRASNETNDEISRLNAELDGIIAEREEAYNGHFDEGLQAEAESRATKYVEEHIMEVADSDVVREEKATDAELEAAKSLLAEFERTAEDNRGEANAAVQAVEEGDTSKEALDYANERVGLVVESDNKVSAQNEKIAELEARREELKRQHKALSDGLRDRAYQQANDEVREIAVQMYDEQIRAKQANLEVLNQRKEELKNRAEEVKRTFRERYEAAKNNIREQAEYANYKHDENGNLVMDDGEAVQIHDVNPEMQFAFFDRVVDELFEDDAVFEKDNALKMNLADQLRVAFPGFNIEFVNDPNYNGAVSVKGKTLRLNANISTARLMSGTLIHEITHICKMSKDYGALFRSATTAVYGTQEAATEAYAEFIKNHPAYDTAVPVNQDYGSYTEMQDEFLAETMEKALGAAGQLTTSSGSVSAYHVDWIKAFAKENVFLAKDLSHWLKMRGKELKKFAVLSKNSAVKKTYNNLAEVVNTLTDLVKDVKRWYDVDEQTADTAETAKPTKKEKAKRKQRAVNEAYVSDLQERADKLNTPAEQTAEETEAPVNQNVTNSAQNASVSDSESISVDAVDNTAEAVDTSETAPASDSVASEVTEDEKLEPLAIEGDTEVLESLAASEGVENFELIYDMPLMAKQDDGTWVALGDTTKEQDAVIEIINQNPNTASAVSAAQVGDLSPESIVEQASIALDSKLTTEQKKAKLKGPTAARVKMLTKMAQADPVQLNVNDIKVDAETYQFKGGSNEEGVTDSDAITGDYSEGLLDPITVYERKNGDYYVINGHHRLALAKANGADTIRATVIHESDGVTEETARVFGAVQNMAQGKGTALDAAKIFREAKIEPTAASLKAYGLSADKGTIDKAAKFAVLSDENFNNLVAGGLSEDTAYVMGKYFADDVQRQNDFAKYVFDHRAQQFTRRQLEILAEEMLRAEYRENTSGEVQASLFDVEGVAPAISNLDERVKLIDSISKSLSQTKNLLTRTNNNAETLTENGNVIATDNNASVVKGTEQARYVLDNRNVNGADAIIGEYAAKIASGDMSIKEATAAAIKDMNGILTAQQTNDVRYQRSTVDEDTILEYLYAADNHDTETAQRIVDEEAKRNGYNRRLAHGTGVEFYTFADTPEGIHLGTLEQATERANTVFQDNQADTQTYTVEDVLNHLSEMPANMAKEFTDKIRQIAVDAGAESVDSFNGDTNDTEAIRKYVEYVGEQYNESEDMFGFGRRRSGSKSFERSAVKLPVFYGKHKKTIMDLYVKMHKPMNVSFDIGSWTSYNIAQMLIAKHDGKEFTSIYTDKQTNQPGNRTVNPSDGVTGIEVTDSDVEQLKKIGRFERSFKPIADFLKSKGIDGIEYLNEVEGSRNDTSVIVLDSNQLKSADPFTYDKNGNLIPIEERFNSDEADVRYQEDTADEDANRAMLYALHNELETAQETMSAADYAKAAGRIIGRIRNLLNDDDKLDTPVRIIKRLADTMGTHIYEGFRDPKQNKAFYEHARAILANKVDASVFGDLMGQVADSVLRGNPNFANQSEDGVYTIAGKSYTADNVNQMFAQWFTKGNGRSEIMRDFDAEMMRYLGTQDAGYRYDVLQARDRMREYFKAEDIRRVGAYVAGLDEKRMQNKRGWRAAWNNFAEAFIDSTVIADQIDSLTGYQSRVREYARYENYGRNTSGNLVSGNRFDDVDGVDTGLKTLSDRLEPILGDAHKTIHENNRKMNLIGEVLMIQSALDRIRNGKNPFTDGTYMAEGEYIGGLATLNEKTLENAYDQIRTEHPEMVEAAKVTREWFQDVLRVYAVDTGMLDEATYTKWQKESPNYAPLMRFMDAETGYGDDMIAGSIGSVKANNLGLTFMKAKGNSDRVVINPLQSMVAMANTMVNKAMSNRTAQEFVRVYDSVGKLGVIGTEITEEQALAARNRNERVLAVFYNSETDNVQDVGRGMEGLVEGKTTDKRNVRYFVLNNSSLFDLLSGTRKVYNNRALETIGKLTKTMTMLTTGVNPLFAFKNAVRDFQHSVIYGSYAYSMADALPKWLSAFVEVAKSKFAESFDEWLFDGKKGWGKGSQQLEDFKALGGGGITRYGSSQNMNVRQLNNDLFGESFARRTASGIGKVLTFGTLNEAIEMTTRYAEYKYGRNATLDSKGATAESKHAAFMSSREATVDFAVKGNSAISYAFRKLFPFFNAQLQGVYQEGRMFSQSQRSELGSRLIKSATNYSLMGALSALACMAFGAGYDADADDDKKTALSEYLNLSDDVKRGYILLPLSLFGVEGSRDIVRVPIVQDFVSNVFYEMGRSGVETVMRATHGEEVGVDDWAVDMFGSAFELLVGQFESEPIWTPISDVRNNRTWYDGTLIRSNLLSKAIPQQYNSGTGKAFIKASAFFNGIAQALGLDPSKWSGYENIISPLGLEYLTQQYTGVIGQLFIPALSPDSYTGEMPKLGSSIVRTFTKGWTLDADSSTDIPDTYESGLDELTAISKSSGSIGTGFLPYGLTKSQYKDAIAEADYLVKNDFKDLNERINDCWSNYTAAMSDSTMTLTQREEAAEAYRKEILRLQGEGIKKYNDYKRKYSVDTTLMGGIIGMVRSVDEQMPVVSNPEKNMYTTRRTYEDSALELPDGYEEEVLRLADATKPTSTTIYGTPPVSFEKDKTTYKLEKYEGAEAAVRDWYGEVLFSKWDELVNSDTYISATDEGKVELIKKLHSEAREYAKNQFFKEYVGN